MGCIAAMTCPSCGAGVLTYRNTLLTVDAIIETADGRIVLIERHNPPHGWALPGGFVDYGERLEVAARREVREETGVFLTGLRQFRAYSDPARDPRHHTVTVVFMAQTQERPQAPTTPKDWAFFRQIAFRRPLYLITRKSWPITWPAAANCDSSPTRWPA